MHVSFAHISDTHVVTNPTDTLRGGQPLTNLNRALREIADLPSSIDFILHTGDICGGVHSSIGTTEGYQQVHQSIATLDVPCYFTLGNHDHPDLALNHLSFPPHERLIQNDPWSYTFLNNGLMGIVLNGRINERGRGQVPKEQLEALVNTLSTSTYPVIISLHFTPLLADQHWNDHYMILSNGEALHTVLLQYTSKIKGVFFGHLHRPLHRLRDGILYVCGPSTAYGIDFWSGERKARILNQRSCGWNWVQICDRGTEVRSILW